MPLNSESTKVGSLVNKASFKGCDLAYPATKHLFRISQLIVQQYISRTLAISLTAIYRAKSVSNQAIAVSSALRFISKRVKICSKRTTAFYFSEGALLSIVV